MNAFELKTGSSETQAQLTQFLQQEKIEFIQTAGGICVKTPVSRTELVENLVGNGITSAEVVPIAETDCSPDMEAFLVTAK